MAPKGNNTKKESGRAKKAENEAKKQDVKVAEKEKKEAAAWEDGAKNAKDKEAKEEKRKAELARKAENARLLAEEEASVPSKPKAAPKVGAKKTSVKPQPKPAGPGAIAAGGGLGGADAEEKGKGGDSETKEVESYAATGIDNALDLLEVVTAKMDKASVGSQAAGIEKHPERRFKAAFEAYQERELPNLKEEVRVSCSTAFSTMRCHFKPFFRQSSVDAPPPFYSSIPVLGYSNTRTCFTSNSRSLLRTHTIKLRSRMMHPRTTRFKL